MNWKEMGLNIIQRYAADVLAAVLANRLKTVSIDRLERFMVHFGKAFFAPGLRHFSELTPAERIQWMNRVPVLAMNHEDWPKPLRSIPRALTVWIGPMPQMSDVILGNVTELKPIPNNGEYYVLRGYMASTTDDGWHWRLGLRPDDVDGYHSLSVTVKKVN